MSRDIESLAEFSFKRLSSGFIIKYGGALMSPLGIQPISRQIACESLGGAVIEIKTLIEKLEEELEDDHNSTK